MFGTSRPMTLLPGMGASMRTRATAIASARSSARLAKRLIFSPCAGSTSKRVTVGPRTLATTRPSSLKLASVASMRRTRSRCSRTSVEVASSGAGGSSRSSGGSWIGMPPTGSVRLRRPRSRRERHARRGGCSGAPAGGARRGRRDLPRGASRSTIAAPAGVASRTGPRRCRRRAAPRAGSASACEAPPTSRAPPRRRSRSPWPRPARRPRRPPARAPPLHPARASPQPAWASSARPCPRSASASEASTSRSRRRPGGRAAPTRPSSARASRRGCRRRPGGRGVVFDRPQPGARSACASARPRQVARTRVGQAGLGQVALAGEPPVAVDEAGQVERERLAHDLGGGDRTQCPAPRAPRSRPA